MKIFWCVLVLVLSLAAPSFAQLRSDRISSDTLNYLKDKGNEHSVVDLSSLADRQLAGRKLKVSARIATFKPSICEESLYEKSYGETRFRLTKRNRVSDLTLKECKARAFSHIYSYKVVQYFPKEISSAPMDLKQLRPETAHCLMDQFRYLSQALEKRENEALLAELDVNEIKLDLYRNVIGGYDDSDLTFGLSVTLDPIMTVKTLLTTKGECKLSSAQEIEEVFIRWSKDASLQAIRNQKTAASNARAKLKTLTNEASSSAKRPWFRQEEN